MRKLVNKAFRQYYKWRMNKLRYFMENPIEVQEALLGYLLKSAKKTEWGKKYDFQSIKKKEQFSERIPIQDYDTLKPFIKKMMNGEKDILWQGKVEWFSKSSGTTRDKSKFIPVSYENLKECHIKGSWDTMAFFYDQRPDAKQFECKNLVMGGSLHKYNNHVDTMIGDISAIMLQHIPMVGQPFITPDLDIALLKDFDEKIQKMAKIVSTDNEVVAIGGVPTWTIVLFRKILELTGKENMLEVWPQFQVYVHGGVSFLPYKEQFKQLLPSQDVNYFEVYNASEGYFATANELYTDDMLLLLDNGIYYEFIPPESINDDNPIAIPLENVELNINYAIVISTNSGLWRYIVGDTVIFTSLNPYKIKITGRTQQFINAFGEEVMVANTDNAIAKTCEQTGAIISEYSVAPIYFHGLEKGGHEWLIEFEKEPDDLDGFNDILDLNLQKLNSDYESKRFKNMALERLKLHKIPQGTFHNWLREKGKYGGQHKVPRLSNDRRYVDDILKFLDIKKKQ